MNKEFNIPSEFEIFGMKWTVEIKDNLIHDSETLFGMCEPSELKIYLSKSWGDKAISGDIIETTFCHELCHAIAFSVSRMDLYNDESFSDIFGNAIHQVIKQINAHAK